ncbi:hypothetical protein CYLTODRAFT_408574 [Cylindrobasidium torrendii FP15055 ss-10]|uniref:Uncharacterized protein n=1 Tax=Cylindrobasidium torrendii FP15055 ss-10 TaxID=1314674 RepID=A0A0D7BKU2_9AGAR|nr:hypothetical protein CYLTODRAFT_408574 [Cylindrobasidium torrendii FP15055 ss-10]
MSGYCFEGEVWIPPLEPSPIDVTFDYGRRYSDKEVRAARLEGLPIHPKDPDYHDAEGAAAFEATDYEDDDGGLVTTESEDDGASTSSSSSAAGSSDSTRTQTRTTIKRQRSSDSISTIDAGQDPKRLRMTFTDDFLNDADGEATNPPTTPSTTETPPEPELPTVNEAQSESSALANTRDTNTRAATTGGAPSNLRRAPASTSSSSSNQIDWTSSPGVNRDFSFARVAAHAGLVHQRDNRPIAPHEIAPGIHSATFTAQASGAYNLNLPFGGGPSMPWPPPRAPAPAPPYFRLPNPALPPGWPPLLPYHAYRDIVPPLPLPPIDSYAPPPVPPFIPPPAQEPNAGRGHVTRGGHAPAPARLTQPQRALKELLPIPPPPVPSSNPAPALVNTTVSAANDSRAPSTVPAAHVPRSRRTRYVRVKAKHIIPSAAPAMASTMPSSSTVIAVNAAGPSTLGGPQQPLLPAIPTTTTNVLPSASTPVGGAIGAILAMALPAPPRTGPPPDTHSWPFVCVGDVDAGIFMGDVNPKEAKVLRFRANQTTPQGIVITQNTIDQLVAHFAARGTTKKVQGIVKDHKAASRSALDINIPVFGSRDLAAYSPKYPSTDPTKRHHRKEDIPGGIPADYADRTKLIQVYPYLSTRALEQGQFDIVFHARKNETNWSCPHCFSLMARAQPGKILPHFVEEDKSGHLSAKCEALAELEEKIAAAN